MIFSYIAIAVFIYTVIYLRSEYDSLPAEMPVHYGIDGKPDQIGSKSMMWLLVGVGAITAIIMTGIPLISPVLEGMLTLGVIHLLCQVIYFFIIYKSIQISRGEATSLGKGFYLLMILAIVLPIALAFIYK